MISKFNMWTSGFCAAAAIVNGLHGNVGMAMFLALLSAFNIVLSLITEKM